MSLAKFRVDGEQPEFTIAPFEFEIVESQVVAFDQSLANTGYVQLRSWTGNDLEVLYTGMIRTVKITKGHEDNLERGTEIFYEAHVILDNFSTGLVIHETPPVGGRMMRPESSLLAAQAIRNAAVLSQVPVRMVAAQKAKKRLTGKADATKQEVRLAVQQLIPDIINHKPLNEHIYDAAALALVGLEKQ